MIQICICNENNMAITYKKAGVDISEIKKSQKAIGRLIASTHKLQNNAKITHGFGHYAGIVEIPGGKLLATHTDGVGTKVIIANMMKKNLFFFLPNFSAGGAGKSILNMCKKINRKKFNLHIISIKKNS